MVRYVGTARQLRDVAVWLFVHILALIGFRNRAAVLAQWAYAYFTYQRSVRLITGPERPSDLVRPTASSDQDGQKAWPHE